jgi:hypothetical protein
MVSWSQGAALVPGCDPEARLDAVVVQFDVVEVLCARCLHPASEDERQCPYCRDDLFDRPVVLVDTDDGRAGRYQGRAHTSVAFASIGLAVWREGTRRPRIAVTVKSRVA